MNNIRKVLVNARDPEEVRVVLINDTEIEDLRWHRGGRPSLVGNIYLGVVTKVEPSLDAAFVDIGEGRAGFLHIGNLHGACCPESKPFDLVSTATRLPEKVVSLSEEDADLQSNGSVRAIEEMLKVGQHLLVQVQRDAVRNKGATLTSFLSVPGRRAVLMPSLGRLALSRRISDADERKRLRDSLTEEKECVDTGLILRTAAAGVAIEEIVEEVSQLKQAWEDIGKQINPENAPQALRREPSPAIRAVRDIMRGDVAELICDSPELKGPLQSLIEDQPQENQPILSIHQKTKPLFETQGIERAWQLLFRAKVSFGDGASLVVHQTEALCAIDVNSGRIQGASLEETALATNLAAAKEIAHQIRLRDLGGIIVVDFIDMKAAAHRQELDSTFGRILRKDHARVKLGGLGSFGLFTLTRRRMGGGLPNFSELICHNCGGSGTTFMHRAGALRALRLLRCLDGGAEGHLRIHPAAATELRPLLQDMENNGLRLTIEEDSQLAPGDLVLR